MELVRCRACELVFAQPQPTDAELSEYYAHYWGGEVAVSTASTRRYYFAQALSRLEYLKRFVDLSSRPRVLDMGAGLGLFHDALLDSGTEHDYVAVESDRSQLDALRSRLGEAGAFADIELIAPAEQFDLIVLAHVLEHVARPRELLTTLRGYMRPGATLFVEVPNRDDRYKSNFESHLLFFDPGSLARLLQQYGEVLDVTSVGAPADKLRITQTFPERGALRPLKEAVKTLLAACTPNFYDSQIRRYAMSTYGGDRQWVRALLRQP